MRVLKIILSLFVVAFLLNFVWEHFHSVLYVHYKGGEITDFILLRAALFDASFIAIVFSPFVIHGTFKKYWWVPVLIALSFAVGLERFALFTDRWAYLSTMPVLPLLGSGLSPTIQLALTGILASLPWVKKQKSVDF